MSNYKRFVSYLYEYVADKKTDNRGFVRIELRSGICRMQFQLKVFSLPEHTPVSVYGCTYSDGQLTGYPLGRLQAGKDGISGLLSIPERIPGTTYTILEFNGLLLTEPQGKFYCSQWDDNPMIPSQFHALSDGAEDHPSKATDTPSEAPSPQVRAGEAVVSEEETASEIPSPQVEATSEASPTQADSDSEVRSAQMEAATEASSTQAEAVTEASSTQAEAVTEVASPQVKAASEVHSAQVEAAPDVASAQAETNPEVASPQMEPDREIAPSQIETASKASAPQAETTPDAVSEASRNRGGTVQAAGSPVMDQAVSNEWAKIKKNYTPCSPFYDDEVEDCVRISIRDFPELRKYGFPLGCNQFIHHGYQNYNHLLLGRMNSSKSCEYVLGVPGVYNSNEQFMASMHGFSYFKPARLKEAPRSGRTGYWLRPIK